MPVEIITLLFFTGLLAGAISAIAGGSGLITFPVLLAIGLPPTVANATNFVSVLLGNITALPAYIREIKRYQQTAIRLVVAGCLGGAIGSTLLLMTDDSVFLDLVPWLILFATLLLAFGKRLRQIITKGRLSLAERNSAFGYVFVFLVSIYGGYFGAGLGVIILATLSIMGFEDFHEANALKNITNAMVGILGVAIYALSDKISWPHAVTLMCGSALGGYLGIKLARLVPSSWLSNAIVVLGFGLALYYFLFGA